MFSRSIVTSLFLGIHKYLRSSSLVVGPDLATRLPLLCPSVAVDQHVGVLTSRRKFWRPFELSCLALLLLLLALWQHADAQIVSGSIGGNVRDSSGAYIPSASITLKAPAIGVSRSTTTTNDGTFLVTE